MFVSWVCSPDGIWLITGSADCDAGVVCEVVCEVPGNDAWELFERLRVSRLCQKSHGGLRQNIGEPLAAIRVHVVEFMRMPRIVCMDCSNVRTYSVLLASDNCSGADDE